MEMDKVQELTMIILFPNTILEELKQLEFDTIHQKILEHPKYKEYEYSGTKNINDVMERIFNECKNDLIDALKRNDICVVKIECNNDDLDLRIKYIILDILFTIFKENHMCQIDYLLDLDDVLNGKVEIDQEV